LELTASLRLGALNLFSVSCFNYHVLITATLARRRCRCKDWLPQTSPCSHRLRWLVSKSFRPRP